MKFLSLLSIIISTLLILTLSSCGKKLTAFTLEDVTSVGVTGGINGEGQITVRISPKGYNAIIEENYPDGLTDLDEAQNAMLFEAGIKIEVDGDTKNVSNGDTITISAIYSEDTFKEFGYKMTDNSFTYTVEGLLEPTVIDIFEGVTVDFDGISGRANATINMDNCPIIIKDNVSFYLKESNIFSLSNGDTITIVAGGNYATSTDFTENAYKVDVTEKKFLVDGLPFYITNAEGYNFSEVISELDKNAEAIANSEYPVGDTFFANDVIYGLDYGIDKWKVNSVSIAPNEDIFWYKDDTSNERVHNTYLRIYTLTINATKVANTQYLSGEKYNDGYSIGDIEDFVIYIESYSHEFSDDGNGVLNTDETTYKTGIFNYSSKVDSYENAKQAWIDNNPDWEFMIIS
jgi:hypothetical protein